jgi:aspartyl-tRNA(Asn)/glutamyl-tRNA(Gln) amidotransferase subunit B
MEYELTAGLEVHVELNTESKAFCACSTAFGGTPNSHCCPICLGLPGVLPRLNRHAVELAAMAGLALGAQVLPYSRMDRKHYHYPDLPKGYQITQYGRPLCLGGSLRLASGREIRIERIHLEEDAGRLIYRGDQVLVDYNRCGVPLIEVVTRPDFHSPEEVREFLTALQQLMRYIGVSDCRMQEGALRCDVNVSVHQKGSPQSGSRVEVKNLNSIAFAARAVEYEARRQGAILRGGGCVERETRRYLENTGTTEPMRGKEEIEDYRPLCEPDLLWVSISEDEIEALRRKIPELPAARWERYQAQYFLSADSAAALVKFRAVGDYFEEAAKGGIDAREVAKLILGPLFARMSEREKEEGCFALTAKQLNQLCTLAHERRLRAGRMKVALEAMLDQGIPPEAALPPCREARVDRMLCMRVIREHPAAVEDLRRGKEKAAGVLVGAVMRHSGGAADPVAVKNAILQMVRDRPEE